MALLLGIKLIEELDGEGGIFADSCGGGGLMAGGCGGVVRWVAILGHALSMVDAEGVPAEGSMGLSVFEGLGLLFLASVLWLLPEDWWFEGFVIQAPCQ